MVRCPSCSADLDRHSAYCPTCGSSLEADDQRTILSEARPTAARGAPTPPPSVASWLAADASSPQVGFPPGAMVGARFRVIGLLGRGGMGEVYRADDLLLGQPVALKFLPRELAADESRLARFYSEVRIARQVSHPNVCRVYDVGEIDGQPYMSMELVDGDDLSSLLRRIGRLPEDKALEVARQMCAGLHAAHEKGVLHRDLKPANVMIDARGKVRITDFGLAVLSEEFRPTESRAGTPAYMAPEQLGRNEVSVQSDLWSLGAVLYEMFTGHRALHGNTMLEVRRELESAAVANPSTMLEGLDPVVERAILRCLEREPGARPASALAVAASLPGGDPLSAALAAGEMPSPEVVAAAGGAGALRPRAAWMLLAGVLAGLGALLPLADRVVLLRRLPFDKPPAVLVDRAREVLRDVGYVDPPVDEAHGLSYSRDYIRWVRDHDKSAGRWRDLEDGRPAAIRFWYRESPQHMYQMDFRDGFEVTYHDPPLVLSGMAAVLLDPQGRLLQLEAVPPQLDSVRATAPPADWSLLFDRAGIDPATLAPAAPEWTPPVYCDQRAAWEGPDPETPGRRLRVEAGAYRGRPNFFQIVGPWTRPARMLPRDVTRSERLGQVVTIALVVTLLVGSVLLARRNVRRGHGDTRGAWKLAVFVFVSSGVAWMLVANHSTNALEEWQSTLQFLGLFTFLGAVYWVLYLALEPAVRRRWPDSLIGWNRLLAGRFRDPGVGRDVLVGMLAGSAMALLEASRIVLVGALGAPPPMPVTVGLDPLLGFAAAAATFLAVPVDAIFTPMSFVFILILLRMLLRRPWLSVAVLVVISLPILGAGAESPIFSLPILVVSFAILLVTLLRYGLLAAITCSFVTTLLERFPGTSDFSVWYAPVTAFVGLVLLALALYAFRTAVGDQPLFGRKLLVE